MQDQLPTALGPSQRMHSGVCGHCAFILNLIEPYTGEDPRPWRIQLHLSSSFMVECNPLSTNSSNQYFLVMKVISNNVLERRWGFSFSIAVRPLPPPKNFLSLVRLILFKDFISKLFSKFLSNFSRFDNLNGRNLIMPNRKGVPLAQTSWY